MADRTRTPTDDRATGDRVARTLGTLERERATGLLRVGDDGAFHLDRGAVTRAESRHAPGPGDLIGALGGPDPELPALLALFDAAYFLLGSRAEPVFTGGPPAHGPVRRITAATLDHERRRRRTLLDSAWPYDDADTAAVVPVRRVRRQRVILTGLQAEILLNADGRRTPAELARDLGRTAFACLLAVRGLAAAALLRTRPHDPAPASPVTPAAPPPAQLPPREAGPPTEWAPADHDLLARLRAALAELG
ncbi:transcriptional regulator [Actinomadura sp. LD22]|uniref:Transcriptional regulator n=1 Tax=Actinomadura physcomitrii TaxID=2650748 RepID=A0A6I4M8I1_9ACTN|nr:transcriptional regulator [Actinomadura physcomitrii]MVZ98988.1 transcriptional regulator [Actinomadura physcomitrii]